MTSDRHLVEVILPSSSTYESVTICIDEELIIAENGASENYCISKWKSRLALTPTDPIDYRVLQLTYVFNSTSMVIEFVSEQLDNDTITSGRYPFDSDEYPNPAFNGYVENFFIRSN